LNRPEPKTRGRDLNAYASAGNRSRTHCPAHIGELASNCRPCASERKAAQPATLRRPQPSTPPIPPARTNRQRPGAVARPAWFQGPAASAEAQRHSQVAP
jgi:hypothetical protein